MIIPYSTIEPFGVLDWPKISSDTLVKFIDEVTSKFFFTCQNSTGYGLTAQMEIAALLAGATVASCTLEKLENSYWVRLEFRTKDSSVWHKRSFLYTDATGR